MPPLTFALDRTASMDYNSSANPITVNDSELIEMGISPRIHALLDHSIQLLSSVGFGTYVYASFILLTAINGSIAAYSMTYLPVDLAFVNTAAFETLLASSQEMRDPLERAHASGQYSAIRSRGELPPRYSY